MTPSDGTAGHPTRHALSRAGCGRGGATKARRDGDESGAVLILALVLLVAISLIVTGLLSFVGTSLNTTASFTLERNVEYVASDAVNLAIANTRYTFDTGSPTAFLNNAVPELCVNDYAPPNQNVGVDVYCHMVWQPYSANTRAFTYSACTVGSSGNASPADCAAQPLLQAVVSFDDYPSGIAAPSPNPTPCQPISANGSCGLSMTLVSWQWNPTVPAVTSLTPSTGADTGGTTVTIQGTGFTTGSTVSFSLQNPTAGSYNPQYSAPIVANPAPGCALPTCLQVTSPVSTSGLVYTVTVTTPGGTSQSTTNDDTNYLPTFTYTPVTPTVSALTGATGGTITGGTPVTITGTGFWSTQNNQDPARVFFCPTGGGSCIAGTVVSISPPAAGSSLDTMSALTPAVSGAGTYYVQVQAYNLTSTQTSVQFTYSVQVPIVISLSPATSSTSGLATGATLNINGANFLTGSTVGFCATGSYNFSSYTCSGSLTSASVQSVTPTQISVVVPSMSTGSYFPVVTAPGASNSSQPYNEPADTFWHS